jgi:hypothetical protein
LNTFSRRQFRRYLAAVESIQKPLSGGVRPMSGDRRQRRDLHALDEDGMVLCNPRDKEAAHRAEMHGIATDDRAAVTCRKCRSLLFEREKARNEGE